MLKLKVLLLELRRHKLCVQVIQLRHVIVGLLKHGVTLHCKLPCQVEYHRELFLFWKR